jgi:hypothetical protein
MPQWLPVVLRRIHDLASKGRVRFTLKALRELSSLDVGLDETDALELLRRLRASDSGGRVRSKGRANGSTCSSLARTARPSTSRS